MEIQNTAHFIMQSKGGAGKSVVAALLAQYLKKMNNDLILIDTDPSNKTLGKYKGLDVQKIEVLNKRKLIDQGINIF
ncbi:TraL-like protein [Moraxella macacae 0408225]|uniref:TraL-like protein n=1 Tax=Moraxella macacae 0408225 TaxID=1230338 RepID=L2F9W9_9GAMM|nr:TraL-like protein [Moraxella macacae]ELA09268.1 TraL-like protein [Moraxella macacae 0408225]